MRNNHKIIKIVLFLLKYYTNALKSMNFEYDKLISKSKCGGDLKSKSNEEIYFALLEVVQETADLDVWQPAFWIPLRHWDLMEMVSG